MKQDVDKNIQLFRKVVLHFEAQLDSVPAMNDVDESPDVAKELWSALAAVFGTMEEICVSNTFS